MIRKCNMELGRFQATQSKKYKYQANEHGEVESLAAPNTPITGRYVSFIGWARASKEGCAYSEIQRNFV